MKKLLFHSSLRFGISLAVTIAAGSAGAAPMAMFDIKQTVESRNPVQPDDVWFQKGNILSQETKSNRAIRKSNNVEDDDIFGLRASKTLALTFDDGPDAETTPELLDLLKMHNVRATFFVIGTKARANEEILRRIRDEGHVLANHTDHHLDVGANSGAAYREIMTAHKTIEPYLQRGGRLYFRGPGGGWNMGNAARLNGDAVLGRYIGPIYWDIGGEMGRTEGGLPTSADWACWTSKFNRTPKTCLQGYMNEIREQGGGIVLMHDIHAKTIEMVRMMLPILKQEGYRMVTLDEVKGLDRYTVERPQ